MATKNRWLELPIAVQNVWESYQDVACAIDDLTIAGNYMQASLLTQAMFSDDRVSACLNTRTNAIFGLPMDFKYPGQDDAEPDQQLDDPITALKMHIRDVTQSEWEDILPGAAAREFYRWGLMLNLGLGELIWRWVPCDQEPDGIKIPQLKVWNTQFVYWRWDTRSFWVNHTGGTSEVRPGDGHWVLLCPFGHNHGWLYGLVNSMGWLYLDRIFLKRNWARANEKWSLGVMKAFVPADANDNDKARFMNAVENMPHEATVMLPITEKGNSFDLEMVKTDQATGWETFMNTKKSIDVDIAVGFLGQNLSTEISGGSGGTGGSKAAAKVHNDIREDILKADVEILATTLKTQILTPFVAANWGAQIEALGLNVDDFVPNVTWQIEAPEDKQEDTAAISALATALPVLNAAGVDIAALLERFDIPMLEGKRAKTRPPPDGDSPERIGQPGWSTDAQAQFIDNMNPDMGQENEKEETLSRSGHLTGHSLKGQLAIDALTKGLREDLRDGIKPTMRKLQEIITSSSGYAERKRRIVELYRGWDLKDVREIIQRSMIAAQLIGRVTSAHQRH
jgi:Protein of unknown function (DUF935)